MHQPAITNRAQKGMSAFERVQSFATPLRWRRLRSCAPRRLSYLAAYASSSAQHGCLAWRRDLVAQCVGDQAAGDIVVRVLPPLTIEESLVREFVETLSAAAAARSAS